MADKRISQLVDRGTVVNSDVVPIVVSGAVTTNKATISSIQTFMQGNLDLGVTSVGITFGTSGTDINASGSPVTSSGNITINLPTASATNRGALSSADWITFNAKQPAGNYVTLDTTQTITAQKTFTTSGSSDTMIISHGSGSGFALDVIKAGNGEAIRVQKTSGSGNAMTISGGNFEAGTIVKTGGTSSQFLKADGSVDSTAYTTNTGTVTSVGLSSATSGVTIGSTPITTSGTITLAIATASGSQNGLLSSTDWTTFNGKQNALTNPVTGTGVNERVALWNGTNSINSDSDFTYNSSTNLLTIGGGITLTGAQTIQTSTGNLTLATAGGNGNILLTPNGTGKVGIGTITPEGSGLTVASGGILVSLDPGVDRKVLELYATSTGAKVSSTYVGASSYDSLQLLTSNEARLTILAGGNVGIGTASPGAKLDVASGNMTLIVGADSGADTRTNVTNKLSRIGASHYTNAEEPIGVILTESTSTTNIIKFGGGSSLFNAATSIEFITAANNTTQGGTEAMRITSAGNVGIGTGSTSIPVRLSGRIFAINSTEPSIELLRNGGSSGEIFVNSDNMVIGSFESTIPLCFRTQNVERMRITSVGDTQPGADNAYSLGVSGTRWSAVWAANGTIQTSDEREKKDIVDSDLGLDLITKLRPVSFKWKVGQNVVTSQVVKDEEGNPILDEEGNEKTESVLIPREGKRTHYGLIAQEVEELLNGKDFGGFIHDEETDIMGLRYDQFVPLLIKAIQEQQVQIDSLKNQIK